MSIEQHLFIQLFFFSFIWIIPVFNMSSLSTTDWSRAFNCTCLIGRWFLCRLFPPSEKLYGEWRIMAARGKRWLAEDAQAFYADWSILDARCPGKMAAEEQCSVPPRWQSISLTHVEYPAGECKLRFFVFFTKVSHIVEKHFVFAGKSVWGFTTEWTRLWDRLPNSDTAARILRSRFFLHSYSDRSDLLICDWLKFCGCA